LLVGAPLGSDDPALVGDSVGEEVGPLDGLPVGESVGVAVLGLVFGF